MAMLFKCSFSNINWSDVQRKNVVNNVDMSSLRAPWQNGPYKSKHTEQHKNTQNIKMQETFRQKHWWYVSPYSLVAASVTCRIASYVYTRGLE